MPNVTVNGPGDCDSMAVFVAIPKDVLKLSFLFLKTKDLLFAVRPPEKSRSWTRAGEALQADFTPSVSF